MSVEHAAMIGVTIMPIVAVLWDWVARRKEG